jgi:CHAT domain-containing protein
MRILLLSFFIFYIQSAKAQIFKDAIPFSNDLQNWYYNSENGVFLSEGALDTIELSLKSLSDTDVNWGINRDSIDRLKSVLYLVRAWNNHQLGYYKIANDDLLKGRTILINQPATFSKVNIENVMGINYENMGFHDLAIKCSENAQSIYQDLGRPFESVQEYVNQSNAYLSAGLHKKAIEKISKLIDFMTDTVLQKAATDGDIGIVLLWMHAHNTRALINSRLATHYFLKRKPIDSVSTYITKAIDEIEITLKKKNTLPIRIDTPYYAPALANRASFYNLQYIYTLNPTALNKALEASEEINAFIKQPVYKISVLNQLAIIYSKLGNYKKALDSIDTAAKLADSTPQYPAVLGNKANIYFDYYLFDTLNQKGLLDSCLRLYHQVLDSLNNISTDNLQTIAGLPTNNAPVHQLTYLNAFKFALSYHKIYPSQENLLRALHISEMSKNFALRNRLRKKAELTGDLPPIPKIQKALLNDTTALIEYFFVGDQAGAFVLSPKKGLRVVRFNIDNSFWIHLKRHQEWLVENGHTDREIAEDAHALYKILLEEPLSLLEGEAIKRLLIVPDEILRKISFEALMAPQSDRYLIEKYTIGYLYSIITQLSSNGSDFPKNRDYQKNMAVFIAGNKENLESELTDMTNTGKYMTVYKADVYEKATKQQFRKEAPNYKIVYFVGHGYTDAFDETNHRIAFHADNTLDTNAFLTVSEISTLKIPCQLLILGSCETEKDNLAPREDISTIARALTASGSQSVIASINEIPDYTSAKIHKLLIDNIYQHNMPYDVALTMAKRSLISKAIKGNEESRPFFWANIVFIGKANTMK